MTKEVFLNTLRGRIAGSLPGEEVEAQISYYASYIDNLVAEGKTEAEAVEELGDPFLIAKTLTNAVEGGYLDADYQYDASSTGRDFYEDDRFSNDAYEEKDAFYNSGYRYGQAEQDAYSGSYGTVEDGQPSGSRFAKTKIGRKWNEWKNSEKGMRVTAIAVLVIALVVAVACIVLFFVACFHVGGCILGGLFPIIIAIVIAGLLFSFLRR